MDTMGMSEKEMLIFYSSNINFTPTFLISKAILISQTQIPNKQMPRGLIGMGFGSNTVQT